MMLLRCLAVAVALCYGVSAGPCRPRHSTTLAASSVVLTDDLASSTVLSELSSDGLGATTLSTGLQIFTTTLSSMSLAVSLDSTLTGSSDTRLTYGSPVSIDPSAPTSTSVALSSIETAPSSDTSTADAAATNTLSTKTAGSKTLRSTSDYKSSTLSETTNADSTAMDDTPTSTETFSLTTEEAGTSTSQASSLSEDTSYVTTSNLASTSTETSTAEAISSETSTTKSRTVKTTSIETSTASTTEVATTTTTIAEPIQPTNYFINGGFEIPNANGEYTGAPSLLGRSVTVKTDPVHALSGTHYAELAFPLVGPSGSSAYAIYQSIAGLDRAKCSVVSSFRAPADMVANAAQLGYPKFSTIIGNTYYESNYIGEVSPEDRYVKRKIVFGGDRPAAAGFVQTRVQFEGLASGSIRFDDISIFEYDPPCTLISPTPSDKWCGLKGSVYGASREAKLLGNYQSLSLEDCVQSCHLEPTCQVISYLRNVGNNIGRCLRYKVPREDIEYVDNDGAQYVYEPGCFSFK